MSRKETEFEIHIKHRNGKKKTISILKVDIGYFDNVELWQDGKQENMRFVEFGNRFRKHFLKIVKKYRN